MKPCLSIRADVNIGVCDIKCADRRVNMEKARNLSGNGCHPVIVLCLFAVLFCGSGACTEIVVKVVGNYIYIAADSRGIEGKSVFDTCKITQIGIRQFFSFAGYRGHPVYDIVTNAFAAVSSPISETDSRFDRSVTTDMSIYARNNGLVSSTSSFTETVFYGFDNRIPTVLRRQYFFPPDAVKMDSIEIACPPQCGDAFILSGTREFQSAANAYLGRNASRIDAALDCVIRAAIQVSPIRQVQGVNWHVAGGEISVGRITPTGIIEWIQRGACKAGPNQTAQYQRSQPTADPLPCSDFIGR